MYDPRYLKGVQHFNNREFFEAHEVWEDVWNEEQGDEKLFVQGLIQFATSLHHFEGKNFKGAKILYVGGMELLSPLKDPFWGLSTKQLMNDMTRCVEGLLGYKQVDLPGRYHETRHSFPVQIQPDLIPTIKLVQDSPHDE